MTYYEWVSYIDNMHNVNITPDMIKKINDFSKDYPPEIQNRFTSHIIDLIADSFISLTDDFKSKSQRGLITKESLILEINNIKERLGVLTSIGSLSLFNESSQMQIKSYINKFATELKNMIVESLKNSNNNEILLLINNIDLIN